MRGQFVEQAELAERAPARVQHLALDHAALVVGIGRAHQHLAAAQARQRVDELAAVGHEGALPFGRQPARARRVMVRCRLEQLHRGGSPRWSRPLAGTIPEQPDANLARS